MEFLLFTVVSICCCFAFRDVRWLYFSYICLWDHFSWCIAAVLAISVSFAGWIVWWYCWCGTIYIASTCCIRTLGKVDTLHFLFILWLLLITLWRVLLLSIIFFMLIPCHLSPSCRVFHCRDPPFYWACSCLPFRVWTAFPDCIDCEVFPSKVMKLLVSDWWFWWLVLP